MKYTYHVHYSHSPGVGTTLEFANRTHALRFMGDLIASYPSISFTIRKEPR